MPPAPLMSLVVRPPAEPLFPLSRLKGLLQKRKTCSTEQVFLFHLIITVPAIPRAAGS